VLDVHRHRLTPESQTEAKRIGAKATKQTEINQRTITVLFGEKGIVEWKKCNKIYKLFEH